MGDFKKNFFNGKKIIMKHCNGYFLLFFFIIYTFVNLKVSAQSEFTTEQIKNTYLALPKSIQEKINGTTVYTDTVLTLESPLLNGVLKVEFNKNHELALLGLQITNDEESEKYAEVLRFLENLFLRITVAEKEDFLIHFLRHNEIELLVNNKTISKPSLSEWKNAINTVSVLPVAIRFSKSLFYATWILSEKNNVIIRFPSDINLIRGMDKAELEADLIQSIMKFDKTSPLPLVDTTNLKEVRKGLYVDTRSAFETDDFRSDIYIEKKQETNNNKFSIAFSSEFPVESFNNLFIYNPSNKFSVETTFMLYKNNKTVKTLDLNLLNTYLSYHCKTYFGLSHNTSDELKATVIYHNPMYNYLHMLVVQSNKKTLFSKTDDLLKASLYLFIPRADLKKGYQQDPANK